MRAVSTTRWRPRKAHGAMEGLLSASLRSYVDVRVYLFHRLCACVRVYLYHLMCARVRVYLYHLMCARVRV